MPRLEQAIISIVEVFEEYARKDDKRGQLSTAELKALMETELASPEFQDKIHVDDLKEAMELLDKNHDGEVNFREFSRCVAALAKGYYKQKRGKGGKKGKGKEEDQK